MKKSAVLMAAFGMSTLFCLPVFATQVEQGFTLISSGHNAGLRITRSGTGADDKNTVCWQREGFQQKGQRVAFTAQQLNSKQFEPCMSEVNAGKPQFGISLKGKHLGTWHNPLVIYPRGQTCTVTYSFFSFKLKYCS